MELQGRVYVLKHLKDFCFRRLSLRSLFLVCECLFGCCIEVVLYVIVKLLIKLEYDLPVFKNVTVAVFFDKFDEGFGYVVVCFFGVVLLDF